MSRASPRIDQIEIFMPDHSYMGCVKGLFTPSLTLSSSNSSIDIKIPVCLNKTGTYPVPCFLPGSFLQPDPDKLTVDGVFFPRWKIDQPPLCYQNLSTDDRIKIITSGENMEEYPGHEPWPSVRPEFHEAPAYAPVAREKYRKSLSRLRMSGIPW